MGKNTICFDVNDAISEVDDRIYGSFIEHVGRAVYDGIYEPDHPLADEQGFRTDVLKAVKALNVSAIRYPGGNFVSGYNWEDGVGPKELRPKRLDLAWQAIETNQVGVHEFSDWCDKAGSDLIMALNFGTRGLDEARRLFEYCNFPGGTQLSDWRKQNGREEPFGIKIWCLGNEMDGGWQIGRKTAYEYGRLAAETAKLLRAIDPSVELVACGSSNSSMPTYKTWEREVLMQCYEYVDYLSLHHYFATRHAKHDHRSYLTLAERMDAFINEVIEICDSVGAEKCLDKKINLSFDEYNVWYHSAEQDEKLIPWHPVQERLEDIYNQEDAVLFATLLNTIINHSDRIKIACLAQLVNVIAPIMTKKGGGMFLQTIYYPFYYASNYGRGTALRPCLTGEKYNCEMYQNVDALHISGVLNRSGELFTMISNRSGDEQEVNLKLKGAALKQVAECKIQSGDAEAVNSFENPENISPADLRCTLKGGEAHFTMPPESVAFVRIKTE